MSVYLIAVAFVMLGGISGSIWAELNKSSGASNFWLALLIVSTIIGLYFSFFTIPGSIGPASWDNTIYANWKASIFHNGFPIGFSAWVAILFTLMADVFWFVIAVWIETAAEKLYEKIEHG